MTKEEKKEYIENIFEMVLSGEENFELAETFIESLNLHDEFKNYTYKQRDKMRVKQNFLESNTICFRKIGYTDIGEIIKEANELHDKLMILRGFLFYYIPKNLKN